MTTPTLKPLPGELPPEQAEQLDRQLDVLRGATASLAPDAKLQAALIANWKRKANPGLLSRLIGGSSKPGNAGWGQFGVPAAALTLSLGFAGWMSLAPIVSHVPKPLPEATTNTSADAPFIALQPMERIAMERDATVVSTTFPRAMLANYGLPVSPERAGEPVRADMLLSGSGQPLALRIIE